MKRFFLCLFLFFMLFTNFSVSADDINETKPGITPESLFYKLDLFLENVSLKLTFKKQNKIEKYNNNARERLAELNKIDPEKYATWIDTLYDEYGMNLNKANELLAELILEEKLDKQKIEGYQTKLEQTLKFEDGIKEDCKNKLNQEIVEKVKEVKADTYISNIPLSISSDQLKTLKNSNLKPNMILKLNSLISLSDYTLDEILIMDIYKENTKDKQIDFKKLEKAIGISKDELVKDLKDINEVIKEVKKENKSELKDHEKIKDKLKEIKDKIKEDKGNKKK